MKIRIKFTKQGSMKFIGHLDMMRYFQRVLRRADVHIRYSEGFSPHPIMSFAAPLGVGVTSSGEYMDIEVLSTEPSTEMVHRINEALVDEMRVINYRLLPDNAENAMSIVAAADYTLTFREGKTPENWAELTREIPQFMSQSSVNVIKKSKKGEREVDILPMIYEFKALDDGRLWIKAATGSAANLKPELAVSAFMDYTGRNLPEFALLINREEVYADLSTTPDVHRFCPLDEFGNNITEAILSP